MNKISFIIIALFFSYEVQAWTSNISFDEMTDEKNGFARTESLSQEASAFVYCIEDGLAVGIVWNEILSLTDSVRFITFRFDKDKPDYMKFNLKHNKSFVTNLKSQNANKLIALMEKHKNLLIRTKDVADRSMTEKFSLAGFTKAYEKACGWLE